MNWVQLGHDECPICRQPMWDTETYKMVDQGIKDRRLGDQNTRDHLSIPSAQFEVDIECSGPPFQLPIEF